MYRETKELYEFGNFDLDVGERKLERKKGIPASVPLREKAFAVLVHLVRNSGRLVGKDELISVAWPDTIVEENNLTKAIHEIRRSLGDTDGESRLIETVPKHGYRFIAEVLSVGDENGAKPPAFLSELSITESEQRSVYDESNRQTIEKLNVPDGSITSIGHDHFLENKNIPEQQIYRTKSFRIAALIFIGLLALGGLLVAKSWQSANPEQDLRSATAQDIHARAYDMYVRGKVKAGIENREETEAAIALLEEAVALEPGLVAAYAQLARAYNTKAFKFASGAERKQFYENAEVAIEKALELDPDLAEAHFARGLILWNDAKGFPHEQAIRSYKRSLELDPTQYETHHQLSMVYAHIGLSDEAKASLDKSLELNPDNTMARFRVCNYLAWRGKFDEALAALKSVPGDVSPLLVERIRAEALIQTGQVGEAETIVDNYLGRYPNDDGGSFTSVKALLLAKAGQREEAENAIRRAAEIGRGFGHFHHTAYNIASAFALMNRPDDAMQWLQKSADSGFPNYSYFAIDPNLDNIRNDPRFVELMKKGKVEMARLRTIVN